MSNQNISQPKPQCCGIFNIISLKKDVYLCLSCVFVYILLRSAVSCFIFNFECFCEILYVAYSAVDVCLCLVLYIVYIFGNKVGIFVHTHSLLSREIVRKSIIMSCLLPEMYTFVHFCASLLSNEMHKKPHFLF